MALKVHGWLAIAALLTATAAGALAQKTFQIEGLEPKRCTEGTTGEVKVVEAGLSAPGKIGGDAAVHWFGMENEGALLEYELPVGSPGRYRIILGLLKSWDYGVYRVCVNGKAVGGNVDLASRAGPEKVLPLKVDLGIHELSREHVLLAIEYVGESPYAIEGPNPRSCGLDYVTLTPATGGTTGGGTTTTGGTTTGGTTTTVGKASTVQLESLEWARCTEGTTGDIDMIGAGFATGGEFGADHVVHWFGMENPGATLEYRVPLAVSGRYRVTLGVARSWDYGMYQFTLNGKPAGSRTDLASKDEPEKVFPLKVDLGVHDLQREHVLLAIKFAGASPNAIDGPNPTSGGFDYIQFTPVPITQTGGTTPGTGPATGSGTAGGSTGAAVTFEADKLRVIRRTSGEVARPNLAEDGYAEPGTFTGNRSLHWHDAAGPGAVLELALDVPKAGRYGITLRCAKYRTYAIHQVLVNGKPVGKPIDMFGNPGHDIVTAFSVSLGTATLTKGANKLALKVVGTNSQTIMANYGAGLDWIALKPTVAAR